MGNPNKLRYSPDDTVLSNAEKTLRECDAYLQNELQQEIELFGDPTYGTENLLIRIQRTLKDIKENGNL